MATALSSSCNKDDDPFDAIAFIEDRIYSEGYKAGYSEGSVKGHEDGHESGYKKGAQIGEEIGFYLGFAETWLSNDKTDGNHKLKKLLNDFIQDLLAFQLLKFHDDSYFDQIRKLRSKYKQINSVLKISTEYQKDTTSLTF